MSGIDSDTKSAEYQFCDFSDKEIDSNNLSSGNFVRNFFFIRFPHPVLKVARRLVCLWGGRLRVC